MHLSSTNMSVSKAYKKEECEHATIVLWGRDVRDPIDRIIMNDCTKLVMSKFLKHSTKDYLMTMRTQKDNMTLKLENSKLKTRNACTTSSIITSSSIDPSDALLQKKKILRNFA